MAKCCRPEHGPEFVFALLCRAWYRPKWQLWNLAELLGDSMEVPFVVQLMGEPMGVCPGAIGPATRTTEQLAELIARKSLGGDFELHELVYRMPEDVEHLLTMEVGGVRPLDARPRKAAPQNDALSELRGLDRRGRGSGPSQRGRGQAGGRGGRAGRGRAGLAGRAAPGPAVGEQAHADATPNDGLVGALPDLLALPPAVVGGDETAVDPFEDMDEADVLEVLAAHQGYVNGAEEEGAEPVAVDMQPEVLEALQAMEESGAGEASSDGGHLPHPEASLAEATPAAPPAQQDPPIPPAPAPVPVEIVGPCAQGYFRHRGQPQHIARITGVFNNSVTVRCYRHSKCSICVAEWKLPSRSDLLDWIQQADLAGGTSVARSIAADNHKAALRILLGAASKPGRTRQSLIDEAHAAEAA